MRTLEQRPDSQGFSENFYRSETFVAAPLGPRGRAGARPAKPETCAPKPGRGKGCGRDGSVPGRPAPAAADEAEPVKVSLKEWDLGFREVVVKGEKVRFEIVNDGTVEHAFELEGEIGGEEFEVATPLLAQGERTVLIIELPEGTYEVYCPVPGHEERGMKGTVTLEGES